MRTMTCVLGREPHLSVAELHAVLGDRAEWARAALGPEALVVPVAADIEPGFLMARLGGMVKIGMTESRTTNGASGDPADVGAVCDVIERWASGTGKLHFGFSVYDAGGGATTVARIRREFQHIAPAVKRALSAAMHRPVRWVTSRESTLSSVVVTGQGLLPADGGVEVLVLVGADRVTLAQTLAVQPYAAWSARDYGRPARSMNRGMLPPKLARAMVNIALASSSKHDTHHAKPTPDVTLLDPFCGTGTILLEAQSLGCRAIGTDVDPQAIAEARENLAWQRERGVDTAFRGRGKKVPGASVQRCDVRAISRCIRARVDAIVTEPYLGPTRGIRNQASGIMEMVTELHALYVQAFHAFAEVLQSGGRVVFIVPAVRQPTPPRNLSIERLRKEGKERCETIVDITGAVARLGFRRVDPFPAPLRDHPVLRGREDLPYARPDQRIGRRILIFERS